MKVTVTHSTPYSEVGQTNPLRWVILRKEDDKFLSESNWWKCKDFLNDWVFTRNKGIGMSIHGFTTHNMVDKDATKPLYLGLKHITNSFFENLKVLNTFLKFPIGVFDNTDFEGESWKVKPVLEIPAYYCKNTYRISLITLLIRLCNIQVAHKDWDAFKKFKYNDQDQSLFNHALKLDLWFKPNPKVEKYIWYCGETANSEVTPGAPGSYIHNNGLCNWGNYLGQAQEAF